MDKTSYANKKGKREGTTVVAQSSSPFLAAIILEVENKIRKIIKLHKIIGIIVFFSEINIILNFLDFIIQFPLKT